MPKYTSDPCPRCQCRSEGKLFKVREYDEEDRGYNFVNSISCNGNCECHVAFRRITLGERNVPT